MPPCGGHQAILVDLGKGGEFQVVPPCGGHPIILSLIRPGMMFQVVPPCGGHRPALAESFDFNAVSSRAPVWGASFICLPRTVIRAVSSRAPVWGASEFLEGTTAAGKFQVVPPCGGHLEMAPNVIVRHLVSSRAPVWGASKNNGIPSRRCGFKSCPRVGGIL